MLITNKKYDFERTLVSFHREGPKGVESRDPYDSKWGSDMMNLGEKKFEKKSTESSVFKAIFYNGSLWENGFSASVILLYF